MNKRWILAAMIGLGVAGQPAWSQSASDADTSAGNDPFVQQRDAIHQINQDYKKRIKAAEAEYDKKEEAASKVLDHAVDVARAERNKAIAAIKAGG